MIAEYQSQTWGGDPLVWKKSYVYAGSRLLSTFTNNTQGGETLEFQHPDRLGTKLVTNNTANTSFEQSTLPFGTALDAETTGTTNQRFTSYDRSMVAQLDYAVNRSYSSGQGRFTSVDPIGMSATSLTNPQSLNLYAYVENNPVDFTDPTGLFRIEPAPREPEFDWSGWWRFLMDSYEHSRSPSGGGGGGGYESIHGGGGGIAPPEQDEPSKECLNALAAMNKNKEDYENAMKLQDIFKSYGSLGPWLAAMAVRESNADSSAIQKGGGGRGLLQVDITQTPGKNYENKNLLDAGRNIEISLTIMNAEAENFKKFGFEGESLFYMSIRNHNAGYFKKNRKVDKAKMREMAKNTNPKDFDVGTTGGNYVSSIDDVAKNCFWGLR